MLILDNLSVGQSYNVELRDGQRLCGQYMGLFLQAGVWHLKLGLDHVVKSLLPVDRVKRVAALEAVNR